MDYVSGHHWGLSKGIWLPSENLYGTFVPFEILTDFYRRDALPAQLTQCSDRVGIENKIR